MERRQIEPQLVPRGFFLKSGTVTIHTGNVTDVLASLPDNKFQCCVTSPPYWGLRDYGTAEWSGGDPTCEHIANASKTKVFGNPVFNENRPSREATKTRGFYYDTVCGHCGAIKVDDQIGMEDSPEDYINNLVNVFRGVWRVLRDDGTFWLNIGDSYATSPPGNKVNTTALSSGLPNSIANQEMRRHAQAQINKTKIGMKPKDLIGIPWRTALALQADGWYLRSAVIWHKPNPMPESVDDRPTTSHEYVFMLTKQAQYFFDQDAVKEKGSIPAGTMAAKGSVERQSVFGVNARPPEYKEYDGFRNIRDVWTINTKPYDEAHFATMPTELAERCIKASSKTADHVLDPFGGSGTTGLMAGLLARHSTLIELNPVYVKIAQKRISRESVPVIVR